MPRLDSPEPEYSSQDSDSDSTDSNSEIEAGPSRPTDYNSNFFAPTAQAAPYVPGPISNGTKHKLEHDDSPERLAKIPRQTFPSSPSDTWSTADDDADADEDESSDDDQDDDHDTSIDLALQPVQQQGVQLHPSFAQQQGAPVHPSFVQQQAQVHPSFAQRRLRPQIHPSLQLTAIQLFRQTYPNMQVDQVTQRSFLYRVLADRPVKRVPQTNLKFHARKPQNVPSYLMQATGEALPAEQSCEKCQKRGKYSGVCVIMLDEDIMRYTSGSCASCWYNRSGCHCTIRDVSGRFRKQRVKKQRAPGNTSLSLPNTPAPAAPQPETAPVATCEPIPAVAGPVRKPAARPVAPPVAPLVQATAAPTVSGSSPDAWNTGWEDIYSQMATPALLEAQRHLLERQNDLMTRLLAMNTVLAARYSGN